MLGADERDVQPRPAREQVREDGQELPMPLRRIDPADEGDDLTGRRAE